MYRTGAWSPPEIVTDTVIRSIDLGVPVYPVRRYTVFRTLIAVGTLAASLALPGAAFATQIPALTIHIKNFMFVPTSATIHVGDRVTFVDDDAEAHTATSDEKSFDSQGLDSGATFRYVFTKPSTIHYFCELHPYMKATLTVLAANAKAPA